MNNFEYLFVGSFFGIFIYVLLKYFAELKKLHWVTIPICGLLALLGSFIWPDANYPFYLFGSFFALIFLLVFIAVPLTRLISNAKGKYKKALNSGKNKNRAVMEAILSSFATVILFAAFFISPFALVGLIFIAYFFARLRETPTKKFLKLQQILPTAKIRSVAMGLAEIEGKITAGKSYTSPLSKTPCYGYIYLEHQVSRNSKGEKSYKLINTINKITPFTLTDETSSIKVNANAENLTLVNLNIYRELEKGSTKYKEYILSKDETYLMIGSVEEIAGERMLSNSPPHNLLGIASFHYVSKWNKYKPLRRNLVITLGIAALLVAFIITVPYQYENGYLTLYINQSPLLIWLF